MRTLAGGTETAIAEPVTQPGYLIEFQFPIVMIPNPEDPEHPTPSGGPVYFSTRGTVNWDGHVWIPWSVRISGLVSDINSAGGTLDVGDTDNTMTSLILNNGGIGDVPVNIWEFYESASAVVARVGRVLWIEMEVPTP